MFSRMLKCNCQREFTMCHSSLLIDLAPTLTRNYLLHYFCSPGRAPQRHQRRYLLLAVRPMMQQSHTSILPARTRRETRRKECSVDFDFHCATRGTRSEATRDRRRQGLPIEPRHAGKR